MRERALLGKWASEMELDVFVEVMFACLNKIGTRNINQEIISKGCPWKLAIEMFGLFVMVIDEG